jgi:hypothetical protein
MGYVILIINDIILSRLHTKRVNENRVIDQQHQWEVINLTVQALETYRKRPTSYLCRWTGMPFILKWVFILVWESLTGIWYFLSSPPQIPRFSEAHLEWRMKVTGFALLSTVRILYCNCKFCCTVVAPCTCTVNGSKPNLSHNHTRVLLPILLYYCTTVLYDERWRGQSITITAAIVKTTNPIAIKHYAECIAHAVCAAACFLPLPRVFMEA